METFLDSQKLFDEYEKNGNVNSCRQAIEILDDLIKEKDSDSQRATNLRNRIIKILTHQMSEMLSYLKGYTKNIKDTDDFVSICENVLNNEEQVKFVQLLQLLDWI